MRKFFKRLIIVIATLFLLVWIISLFAPRSKNIEYGVTFSQPYATALGLDWKKVYLEMLDDLKVKRLRLSAYWNSVEREKGKYNFEDLDFQIDEASKRGVSIILAVGRRLPRWPECHDPDWIKDLSADDLKNSQLSYMETVIRRYSDKPSIIAWQVENEPFLATFGICPMLDKGLLDSEIALVKHIDPSRQILITDSGELSFWIHSGSRGDIFGTTFYRYVFSDVFKKNWTNHIPAFYYRFKAGLLRILHPGKPVWVIELEAEPWTTNGILNTPIEEQFQTMSINNFNTITKISASTGFSPQYLWGVEWWYWMKDKNNHPEFWEKGKELMGR